MNELSIIVPCLASIEGLPQFIDELAEYLMENPGDVETIVVTNKSFSQNISIANYVKNKYPWLKFRMLQKIGRSNNYGIIARLGISYSTSRYAVLVSPYGEDDISLIGKMLSMIRKGAQVVQATRFTLEEDSKTVQFIFRVYQHIFRYFTKIFLGHNISDSTYAFKMFDRVFIQALGLTQTVRSISPEITLKVLLAGGKVEYIPTGVRPKQIGSKFKLHKDGFGYIWLLIRGFGHRIGITWF